MALIANFFSTVDPPHPGINESILQESPIVLEVPGAMADDDTTAFVFTGPGQSGLPPRTVTILRHTGGDITNTVNANWAVNNGDTILYQVDAGGTGKFTQFTHALAGVTNGAATAVQVAASLNADTTFKKTAVAVAGLTANRVTIFPISPRSSIRVVGGTAQTVILFPGTVADYMARVYVSQTAPILLAGTGWSWSYNATTKTLTIQNETGGAVNRVVIFIER